MSDETEDDGNNGTPQTVQITEEEALAHVADSSEPLDVRFEVAASFITNLVIARRRLSSRVQAVEATNFILMRTMIAALPEEERAGAVDAIRNETEKFIVAMGHRKSVSIWDYVGGKPLEESFISDEELAEARQSAIQEEVEAEMAAAVERGEKLEKGECEAGECTTPYECTQAQRCLVTGVGKKDA